MKKAILIIVIVCLFGSFSYGQNLKRITQLTLQWTARIERAANLIVKENNPASALKYLSDSLSLVSELKREIGSADRDAVTTAEAMEEVSLALMKLSNAFIKVGAASDRVGKAPEEGFRNIKEAKEYLRASEQFEQAVREGNELMNESYGYIKDAEKKTRTHPQMKDLHKLAVEVTGYIKRQKAELFRISEDTGKAVGKLRKNLSSWEKSLGKKETGKEFKYKDAKEGIIEEIPREKEWDF